MVISSLICTSLKLLALLSAKLNFCIPSFLINLSHFRLFQTLNKHNFYFGGALSLQPTYAQSYATRHLLSTKIIVGGTGVEPVQQSSHVEVIKLLIIFISEYLLYFCVYQFRHPPLKKTFKCFMLRVVSDSN